MGVSEYSGNIPVREDCHSRTIAFIGQQNLLFCYIGGSDSKTGDCHWGLDFTV